MAVLDLKKVTVKLQDGTSPTKLNISVKLGEGNLSYTEKRPIDYLKDRGLLDTVRLGDEEPVEVKLEFLWEYITSDSGATVPTVEEALKNSGPASAWVSSATADTCAPFALDLVFIYDPTCSGAGVTFSKETITLKYYRYETLEHDMKASQVSTSGNCNVTVAQAVRAAHT